MNYASTFHTLRNVGFEHVFKAQTYGRNELRSDIPHPQEYQVLTSASSIE
jgi:hypothetical protein